MGKYYVNWCYGGYFDLLILKCRFGMGKCFMYDYML